MTPRILMGESGATVVDAARAATVADARAAVEELVVRPLRARQLGAVLEGSWSEESVLVPDVATATRWVAENGETGGATAVIGDDPRLATLVERLVSR